MQFFQVIRITPSPRGRYLDDVIMVTGVETYEEIKSRTIEVLGQQHLAFRRYNKIARRTALSKIWVSS